MYQSFCFVLFCFVFPSPLHFAPEIKTPLSQLKSAKTSSIPKAKFVDQSQPTSSRCEDYYAARD